jgi:MurNAc alpha-1-phosphate uridylyltransferase
MQMPRYAMVAAAGLGTRMRPLTDDKPKALVSLAGKTLLDHQLDRLGRAGVAEAVVNVHHFADQMQDHLRACSGPPHITISSERGLLLETGGGLVRALPHLGDKPFFVMNVDAVWSGHDTALPDLAAAMYGFNGAKAVLLLARRDRCLGLSSAGDFHLATDGRVVRRKTNEMADYYYSGVQIMDPVLLDGFAEEKFSTNLIWDKALQAGALFGLVLDGFWMHVGDPASLNEAEAKLAEQAR